MKAQDHNKTLVILLSAFAAFFTIGVLASPWIVAQNFNRKDKNTGRNHNLWHRSTDGAALVVHGVRNAPAKASGQEARVDFSCAAIAAVLAGRGLHLVFMHSEGAKQMYGP